MLNIVENYRKSNVEFDTLVKQLLGNYNSTEITEEALADVSAQLFGNQEFINNVANTNPSFFRKIYNEIKYLWHQFRGYKNQNEFVEDLYNKWTQAYNSSDNLNTTTNYYIETVADFNEIEYNNAKEIKLPKQEYAILSGIINSDSNIKPGRNYVETTNATYEVYFKETGEFKVVGKIADGGYNDTITNGNIQRTRSSGNAKSGMQVYSSTIQQPRTGTRNDEISNLNKRRTRISDKSVGDGSSNSNNVKYSIQESENNSDSFNFNKNVKRYEDLQEANAIKFNKKTDGTINVEIINNNELINQFSVSSKDDALKQLGSDIANYIYDNANEDSKTIKLEKTKNIEVHATSHKRKQLEIIKKTNPIMDDYHVGIRTVEDIKTFGEVISDEESFAWGDFTKEDAKKALEEGKITVYSSYPINQGTFVSTSKVQAEEYAGGRF